MFPAFLWLIDGNAVDSFNTLLFARYTRVRLTAARLCAIVLSAREPRVRKAHSISRRVPSVFQLLFGYLSATFLDSSLFAALIHRLVSNLLLSFQINKLYLLARFPSSCARVRERASISQPPTRRFSCSRGRRLISLSFS